MTQTDELAAQRCADELNHRNRTDCWEASDFLDACAANSRGNLWRADKERAHHAAEKAKAEIERFAAYDGEISSPRVAETIAALNALILTPPVDPNEAAYQEWISGYCGTFDPEETCMKFSPNEMRKAFFAGLELRTVADGGGA